MPMHPGPRNEFLIQLIALLVSFILIHALYVTLIRPSAAAHLQQEQQRMASEVNYVQQKSLYVVLRDYEQEACLVLMLWALAILAYKGINGVRQQRLLGEDLLDLPPGLPIGQEDLHELSERLEARPEREALPLRALATAVERFAATNNVQDVSTASRDLCESEADRLESELSIIRYIAWAIPSIGFIGTVRGIGDALGQAQRAVQGDITGVTESLGVAFNSTFIALVISIVLMFFIHQLQLLQDRLVLGSERYVDCNLVRRLKS